MQERSLAQLDVEALYLLRREPGCELVFSISTYRIDNETFELRDLVLGQADKDAAERGARHVENVLRGQYCRIGHD